MDVSLEPLSPVVPSETENFNEFINREETITAAEMLVWYKFSEQ